MIKINLQKKNFKLIINYLFIILFIILYVIASIHKFNLFYYIYPNNNIPLYLIIISFIIVIMLLLYNTYIGLLYAILLIFQLKCIKYENFNISNNTSNNELKANQIDTKNNKLTIPFYIETDDERFKIDDVKIKQIIRQIQAELQFDPSKTPLARKVIIDIYKKYFDNDIFVKLNEITQESEKYTSEYQLLYTNPTIELGYDVDTAKILQSSTSFGVSPNVDTGIRNIFTS